MTGPGQWVGPRAAPNTYRLDRLLGGGGEGEVWQATLPLSENGHSNVAVKILFCRTDEPNGGAQWERHGHLLQSLSHPGLVRVTNTFVGPRPHRLAEPIDLQSGLRRYVVMDFIEGSTLRSWIEQNPNAASSTRLQMLRMVADALDEMHSGRRTKVSVAHGDVKPSNIIVRENGDTVLVDLGLTRLADAAGVSGRSRPYAAPEMREFNTQATSDADRFAFVVTVAETLTGVSPPTGADGFLNLAALQKLLRSHHLTSRRHTLVRQVLDALEVSAEQRPRQLRPWLDATAELVSQVTDLPVDATAKPVGLAVNSAALDRSRTQPVRRITNRILFGAVLLLVVGGTLAITWPSSSFPGPSAGPLDSTQTQEPTIISNDPPVQTNFGQPSPSGTAHVSPVASPAILGHQAAPVKADQSSTPTTHIRPNASPAGRIAAPAPSSPNALLAPTGQPGPTATPQTLALVCTPKDQRYQVARLNQSPSATEIGLILVSAYFFLDRGTSPATMNVSGQVQGNIPPGMNFWLVDHPKNNTFDSTPERNPGSDRYYPIEEIAPMVNGCWSVRPHTIGYDEALGITFEHIFMLVPDSVEAEFKRPKDSNYDGFDPTFRTRSDIRILGDFDIATTS